MGVRDSNAAAELPHPPARRTEAVAEETRALILAAAEEEFALRGFHRARLEDIAERVRITRAAIIYHFGDKQALYTAALEATFAPLGEAIRAVVAAECTHRERVQMLIDAWLEVAERRPTLARLFTREVVDAPGELRPEVERIVEPMFALVTDSLAQGQAEGAFRAIDPVHLVSILAGAMVWFVTHAPVLGGERRHHPDAAEFASFRAELVDVARYLLETRDPGPPDPGPDAPQASPPPPHTAPEG